MKTLNVNQMEIIEGGDFIGGLCVGIGTGSVVYAVGLATQWWNPVGWVSGAFLAADAACIAYGTYQVLS